jgi:hypothetical protein
MLWRVAFVQGETERVGGDADALGPAAFVIDIVVAREDLRIALDIYNVVVLGDYPEPAVSFGPGDRIVGAQVGQNGLPVGSVLGTVLVELDRGFAHGIILTGFSMMALKAARSCAPTEPSIAR